MPESGKAAAMCKSKSRSGWEADEKLALFNLIDLPKGGVENSASLSGQDQAVFHLQAQRRHGGGMI